MPALPLFCFCPLLLGTCPGLAKAPAFEPDAAALKIFDVTDVEFSYDPYGSKIKTERKVRIKIVTESGFAHASIRIP